MNGPVDVLAVMDEAQDWLYRSSEGPDSDARAEAVKQARAAVAELIADHKALYRHYVNMLESARDRIIALGGDCDLVDRMEQGDPVLARSRAALANVGSAS